MSPSRVTSKSIQSVLVVVVASVLASLAAACTPSTLPAIAFEPRAYPYVPQSGLPDSHSESK